MTESLEEIKRKFRDDMPWYEENMRRNEEYFRLKLIYTALDSYKAWIGNIRRAGQYVIDYESCVEVLDKELKELSWQIRNKQAREKVITLEDVGKQAIIYQAFIPKITLD